ncbi:hypothetical protein EVAR_90660_1 [Eumeta japonica]|uniref:Pre-C2HC domain-containing protein n=1 Tax=Eumeta variegata TaxID=151549 RepID=A0A4C1ZFH5_EUMVA|nr:hypothetical protein EVAR_90660_1 [Eumeta japonica]
MAKAPSAAKITTDEADVIETITPKKLQRPPHLFIHDKGHWSKIRKQCDSKRIVILNVRNTSYPGLPEFIRPSRDTQSSIPYLLLEEGAQFFVVLRGVLKELPIEEVQKDLLIQNLPVQSVRRITNRVRKPLDLVLVTAKTTSIEKATKRTFFNSTSVYSITGIKVEQPHKKSIPGQCFNYQLYGHLSKNCYQRTRWVKCLGDHVTAA